MTITDLALPISLSELRHILKKHAVLEAKLFGSYARGEQNADSDLDLFVRCSPMTSLFDIFDLQTELEQAVGIKVDLVTKINPHFSEYVEPDLLTIDL